MRKRGQTNWKGEHALSKIKGQVLQTEISSKLMEVGKAIDSVITQKDLGHFLKNSENALKLNDLVEDIRDALMEYQVRTPNRLTPRNH